MATEPQALKHSHPWIELAAARHPRGMARRFVHVDDAETLRAWRTEHANTDIYASICRFATQDRQSSAVCPCFFDIDADGQLDVARAETLRLLELFQRRIDVSPGSTEIFFSGAKGFHVVVPLGVFNAAGKPGLLPVWRLLANRFYHEGLSHIDLSVYQQSRLLRLPNSINSKRGLYKRPLQFKDLRDLPLANLLELARHPCETDSMALAAESPKAAAWLTQVQGWLSKRHQAAPPRPSFRLSDGWRTPPCIRRVEGSVLPDGMRHAAYRAISRFYATTGMAPQEAVERLQAIDQRHPIRDPDYIDRMVRCAWQEGGFAGCPTEVLSPYCDRHRCFLERHEITGRHRDES